jgi:PIF1-like helicase
MSSLAVFETIDEVLQMSTGCKEPFGGKTILGIGDFHQVAPVIPGAGPSEILAASIKSSSLWSKFSIFSLTTPMRFGNDQELCNFVDAVGEGWDTPKVSVDMFKTTTSLEDAAEFLYPAETLADPESCLEQAFLSPRNILVDDFNNLMLEKLPGETSACFCYIIVSGCLIII